MAVIRLQLERLTASYRYYFLIPRLSLSLLVLYTFTLPLDSSKRTMILTFVIISIYTFFLFLSIRIGFTNSLETPYAGLFALINLSYQSYYCKKQSSLIFIMSYSLSNLVKCLSIHLMATSVYLIISKLNASVVKSGFKTLPTLVTSFLNSSLINKALFLKYSIGQEKPHDSGQDISDRLLFATFIDRLSLIMCVTLMIIYHY